MLSLIFFLPRKIGDVSKWKNIVPNSFLCIKSGIGNHVTQYLTRAKPQAKASSPIKYKTPSSKMEIIKLDQYIQWDRPGTPPYKKEVAHLVPH